MSLPVSDWSAASTSKKYVYSRDIVSKKAYFDLQGTCVELWFAMNTGDFFEGLEWKRVDSHDEFRKKGQTVVDFPGDIAISVLITAPSFLPCSGRSPNPSSNGGNDVGASITSLHLDAAWKTGAGLETRPAEIVSPFKSDGTPRKSNQNVTWIYHARLHAKGVPLHDVLVISALDPDRRLLGRVAIDLTTPMI
jgi:hypothetical protein